MYSLAQQMLQPAINVGLSEFDFWNMTIAEITRYIEGAVWRMKQQAYFNYTEADLIGVSIARILSSDVEYPPIEKCYPELFKDSEEAREAREEELRIEESKNRFMEFALKHNAQKRKGVENKNNE